MSSTVVTSAAVVVADAAVVVAQTVVASAATIMAGAAIVVAGAARDCKVDCVNSVNCKYEYIKGSAPAQRLKIFNPHTRAQYHIRDQTSEIRHQTSKNLTSSHLTSSHKVLFLNHFERLMQLSA